MTTASYTDPCPSCKGTGTLDYSTRTYRNGWTPWQIGPGACYTCKGTGEVTITVTLPAFLTTPCEDAYCGGCGHPGCTGEQAYAPA